jgi:hypothetical protein
VVEVLEEIGEGIGGQRTGVNFGRERLQEPATRLAQDLLKYSIRIAPLGQAPNLDRKLLEGIWQPKLGSTLLVSIFLGGEDVAIVVSVLAFRRQPLLKGIQDAGHWWALEGACSTAGQGTLCGGRRLEAGEGL